jgi:hypothetical protein
VGERRAAVGSASQASMKPTLLHTADLLAATGYASVGATWCAGRRDCKLFGTR